MTALELLQQLNALDEHNRIEAKTSSELGKSTLQTICALANEPGLGGGWLLLGAKKAENTLWPQYETVGLDDPDKVSRDLVSQCASVLHETNLAENKGSGIRVMRELMNLANLTPPTFESDRERNNFVVTLLFHHFLSPEDWVWLRQLGVDLNDEEARALIFVREAGAINNAAYRDINHVDVLNASTHLRRLRDNELLAQKGKGAETYYVPTEKFFAPLQPPTPSQPVQQVAQPSPDISQLFEQRGGGAGLKD